MYFLLWESKFKIGQGRICQKKGKYSLSTTSQALPPPHIS